MWIKVPQKLSEQNTFIPTVPCGLNNGCFYVLLFLFLLLHIIQMAALEKFFAVYR
jgi:hypothetical protein